MYLGSPSDNKLCPPIGLVPPKCFWLGLDEAPLTREHYRSALRDVSGDSPFTQPPFAEGCCLVQCREQCNEQRD